MYGSMAGSRLASLPWSPSLLGDFNYGALPRAGGQIAFAGITSFVVAFFGVVGLNIDLCRVLPTLTK